MKQYDRKPPHERYDGETNWHSTHTLPDGTSVGGMGANSYILSDDGVPLQIINPTYYTETNGFHSIAQVDDGEYVVNSGGGLGSWALLERRDNGLYVQKSFKGKPPAGAAPVGGKARRHSLARLNQLPLSLNCQRRGKQLFYGGFFLVFVSVFFGQPRLTGLVFVITLIGSILLYLGGILLGMSSKVESRFEWDV